MQFPYQVNTDDVVPPPLIRSAPAGADGTATVTIDPDETGRGRLIDYLVVSAATTARPGCNVYDNDVQPSRLFDGTSYGAAAVAAYSPPRVLMPGRSLVVVWSSCNPGDECTARLEYRLL